MKDRCRAGYVRAPKMHSERRQCEQTLYNEYGMTVRVRSKRRQACRDAERLWKQEERNWKSQRKTQWKPRSVLVSARETETVLNAFLSGTIDWDWDCGANHDTEEQQAA